MHLKNGVHAHNLVAVERCETRQAHESQELETLLEGDRQARL